MMTLSNLAAAALLAISSPQIHAASDRPGQESSAPIELDLKALGRADRLLERSKFEEARDAYESLVALGVEDARVQLGLGRALSAIDQHHEAVEALLVAARLSPDDYDVRFALGKALHAKAAVDSWNGEYEAAGYGFLDASAMLAKAGELRPGVAEPWLLAARAERDRGDPEAAIELAERGLREQPDDVLTHLELGGVLFARLYALQGKGDLDGLDAARARIAEVYQRVLELDPDNGYAVNGQAWLALERGDRSAAADLFHQSLLKNPTLDDSYRNLRGLMSETREDKEALAKLLSKVTTASSRYSSGAERNRGKAIARYQLGITHKDLRDVAAAKKDFDGAARLSPELEVPAQYQIATAFLADNQQDEAIDVLLKQTAEHTPELVAAIQADFDPVGVIKQVRYLVTRTYNRGKLNDARSLARVVAEAAITNADDWNNYAFFCRETSEYEDAYEAYSKALELTPNSPRLLNDAALILQYHLGREIEYAADLYERAILQARLQLEDDAVPSAAKLEAADASRDAENNLKMLRAGHYKGSTSQPEKKGPPKKKGG